MATFSATYNPSTGIITLAQDSAGALFSGTALVTVFDPTTLAIVAQSNRGIIAGNGTWNITSLIGGWADGTYRVSAVDRTFGIISPTNAKSHPTATLIASGGAVTIPAGLTWIHHAATPVQVFPGGTITSSFQVSGSNTTFAIQVFRQEDHSLLYSGNLTIDLAGLGTVTYPAPTVIGTIITPLAIQPYTLDAGIASSNTVEVIMSGPPTGEGTGSIGAASYHMTNSSGAEWHVRGTGPDAATALAEANAKLALTVGTIESTTQTVGIPSGSQGTAHGATGDFEDAVITMSKSVSGRVVTRTVRLNNISTAYKLSTGTKGMIDGSAADIAAFCSAYRDGDGLGGYTFLHGHYTK